MTTRPLDANSLLAAGPGLRERKHNWPKYSVMDAPRPFSGTIGQEKAGWYYVVTNQTFPFRGSTWYPVQTICLGLHHTLIFLDDIKYEYIPSTTLAKDHLNQFEGVWPCLEEWKSTCRTTTCHGAR